MRCKCLRFVFLDFAEVCENAISPDKIDGLPSKDSDGSRKKQHLP